MHLLALVAVGLIVTTKVRAQRSSGGCDVVPDGLSACASPTSFHICHKRAPLPFAFSCPEDEYCCNGGCSPNPVCEKWNPCSETEVGIACVDITSFKHCVNNKFYWEKPQQCAPGTLCCNNACLHENDDACDAEKDKYEVRKRELRVLLERVTGDDEFDYAKWEMGPAQWKDYFGRKEVTYRSHEVYVNKKVVGVWNFGFASGDCQDDIIKTNRVIYPITSTGLPAGPPIFEKIPQDEGYSDAVLRYDLLITDEEEWSNNFNELFEQNEEKLVKKGYFNWPVVPRGSQGVVDDAHKENFDGACQKLTKGTLKTAHGFYKDYPIWFIRLGAIPNVSEDNEITAGNAVFDKWENVAVDSAVSFEEEGTYTGFYKIFTAKEKGFRRFNRTELSELEGSCASRVWNARTAFVSSC